MTLVRLCLLLCLACRSGSRDLPAADLAAERFSARGRITAVRATELEIHHEHIAQIRTLDGTLEPMEPMVMVFSATTNAPIDGLVVGDAVKFDFTTHYRSPPRLRLIAIEKLPAGTQLVLP